MSRPAFNKGITLPGILFFLFLINANNHAQVLQSEEDVKSNIIFNLCEYFTWPGENGLNKIVIAVFEDDSQLFPFLSYFAQNKRIKNKPVEIKK